MTLRECISNVYPNTLTLSNNIAVNCTGNDCLHIKLNPSLLLQCCSPLIMSWQIHGLGIFRIARINSHANFSTSSD